MQDKRPTFHRANIESILFSPCKHILFFSLCQSYLIKNACHSTTPIPQGNTIKCHSEATPKNLVVATTRGCLIYPHKKRLAQCIASTARTTTPLVILSVYCLMHSAIYTVRTVGLLVILSVAKNLVVAPARVCLTYPHKKRLAQSKR